ncbi:hypothetical protein NEOLI_004152 [Neolecta irregularis DAH-3]|uniref:Uncharacterized protein n=1 Tax=Neolecta irregularis (strain DAH-3) TaxID=1198029 RepID=A0A1U7LUM2_NEOID|nr:hypothetical protein NEOLI_004152 [Neolecta irregularis DAH-3]|eukprot:OLL26375.1 hypothetical protein NEOLI_004152 [Neolecta irregularis DAH-3]
MPTYQDLPEREQQFGQGNPKIFLVTTAKLSFMALDEQAPLTSDERTQIKDIVRSTTMWGLGCMFFPPVFIGLTYQRPDVQRWLFSSRKPSFTRIGTVLFLSSLAGDMVGTFIGARRIARTVHELGPGFRQRYVSYEPSVNPAKIPQNTESWPIQPSSRPDPLVQDRYSINKDPPLRPPLSRWEEIRQGISKESIRNPPVSNMDYSYETPKSASSNESTGSQSLAQKEFDSLLENERKMADQEFM